MSNFSDLASGAELLKIAHHASAEGAEVHAHIDGLPQLSVREVRPITEGAAVASIVCWLDDQSKTSTWFVPLNAVRGVKIDGDWVCG